MILENGILHNDDGTPYKDILYGEIPAEQLHVDLINTEFFQRMGGEGRKGILQNGFSAIDFPGLKNNTRFGHSIGVFHKTNQILEIRKKRNVVHPAYQRIAKVSALLHDLGHIFLSHAGEAMIGVSHEEWTKRIIEGDTDVNRVLTAHGFTEKDIKMLTSKTGFFKRLLDGAVDNDKQDYLPRDAHWAGKKLGTNFDRIMQSLIVAFNEAGDPEICIDKKYLSDIDQMMSERRWMYQNVYFSDAPMTAESALLPMVKEYVPFLIKNGYITDNGIDPVMLKILLKSGDLSLSEFAKCDEGLWNDTLDVLSQKDDKLLRCMTANHGEDSIKNYNVSYVSKEDAEEFDEKNEKSFGLTKRVASYKTYKEGGIRVAYPDGNLRELATVTAFMRESADTKIVDTRICENPEIMAMEKLARQDEGSALGRLKKEAEQTSNNIDRD